jgi:hypothetical protein
MAAARQDCPEGQSLPPPWKADIIMKRRVEQFHASFFAATLGPFVLKVGGRFYELSVKTRKDY